MRDKFYLSIERISLQLIHTLKAVNVALCHYQTVLISLEEVRLVQHIVLSSSEAPLFLDIDISAPLPILTKSSRLLLVSALCCYSCN